MIEAINKVSRASRKLIQEYGREPTPEEVAKYLAFPVEKVKRVMKASMEPISLDRPIGEDEDSNLGDFIEDTARRQPGLTRPRTRCCRIRLTKVLSTLTRREEKVIRLRFGLGDGTPAHPGGGGHHLPGHPRARAADRGQGDSQAPAPQPRPQAQGLRGELLGVSPGAGRAKRPANLDYSVDYSLIMAYP